MAAPAEAQTCESDDECAKGKWCADESGQRGGDVSSPPCDPGANGECEQPEPPDAPDRTCQPFAAGVCESDADCTAGLRCEKGVSVGGCAPAPGAPGSDGSEECSDEPRVERYGSCTYDPPACEKDADCLAGLRCVENPEDTASSPPNMGSDSQPAPIEKSDAKVCVFAPTKCAKTSDCSDDYECAEVVVGAGCSGSSGGCSADGDCEEPAPEEEECDEIKERFCLPKETPCDDDAACPGDWKCLTFGEDGLSAPPNWSAKDEKRCLPEGIALVIQGGEASGGFGSTEGADDVSGEGAKAPGSAKSSSSSSCAVDGAPTSSRALSSWWLGAVGLAGALALRRRTRAVQSSSRR